MQRALTQLDDPYREEIPIGPPIRGGGARVLDEQLVPRREGETGELYLTGPMLARGYRDRAALTAERFVADPHGAPGSRMYRTGDLAAWSGGQLMHRGRADEQLKIRGFRVEPRELTLALERVPGVREAVAFGVADDAAGGQGQALAAAIAGEADDARITRAIGAALPGYFQPARIVRVTALPRTATGKVDLAALRALAAERHAAPGAPGTDGPGPGDPGPGMLGPGGAGAGAPGWAALDPDAPTRRGPVPDARPGRAQAGTLIIARAMSEALGRPLAAHDDFFAAGGHSLTGLRLVSILAAQGIRATLRDVLAAPAPSALAAHLALPGAHEAGRAPDGAEHIAGVAAATEETAAQHPLSPGGESMGGTAFAAEAGNPLSPAEERMLLLHRLGAGDAYRIPVRWSVRLPDGARLCEAGMVRAWQLLLERHPALRTSYPLSEGRSIPREHPASRSDLLVTAAQGADAAASLADRQLREALAARLDPAAAPPVLIRCALWEGGAEIALVAHHVVTDEHGLGVLAEELAIACDALARGEAPRLPRPALGPRAFARLQAARRAEREAGEVAAWCRALAGHRGAGELPGDAGGDERGAGVATGRVRASVPLAEAAARLGVTPFMLAHAAVALVLSRARAGDDLVLASPIAAREDPAEMTAVECATNTVAIRHRTIGSGDVRSLVSRARDAVLDAMERSCASFDAVQRAVGGPPLTDVFVSFFDEARARFQAGGTSLRSRIAPVASAKAPLSFALVDGEDGAEVMLEYDRARFTPLRAAALAEAVATVIGALSEPEAERRAVAEVPLVSPEERERLLGAWAGEAHALPLRPFAAWFLECAAREGDAPALSARDPGGGGMVTLSYRQLADRALRIAALLREEGAGPGQIVAVASDRTTDLVASHVAVLLSGATFLALDPALPAERISLLLGQLPPRVLLTSGCELAASEPAGTVIELRDPRIARRLGEIPRERIGALREQLLREPADELEARVRLDAIAYAIFTSGSTGMPKAVAVPQRGVTKLIATQRARLGSVAGRRVLYFASPVFDAAFWQLCGTLCEGSELVVMPDEARLPGPGFLDFVRRERIDVISVPPSVLAALPGQPPLPEGSELIVGAERLPRPLAARWAGRHRLVNAYGPTEATVNTSLHECDPAADGPVPIGRPDPGARCYVTDPAGQLCPVGFPGELLIGGEGVATGYLDDARRTAVAFGPDPSVPGGRCYRSGDLVEWRPDGELRFIGRIDEQLKIRGFRVEPGEIEAVLLALPGVRQAAVAAKPGGSGDRLVAYVVAQPAERLHEAALRAACRERLAAHLVPDRVVVLDAIPRLPSGKLDRRALPEPARAEEGGGRAGTPLERAIGEAFAGALGLPGPAGPDEDFFELGGSSLLAAGLLERIAPLLREHGASGGGSGDFSFADVLAAPTPAGIARAITARASGGVPFSADPLGMELLLRRGTGHAAPVWFLPPLAGMSWAYAALRRYLDPAAISSDCRPATSPGCVPRP